jgi:hypothetical protein
MIWSVGSVLLLQARPPKRPVTEVVVAARTSTDTAQQPKACIERKFPTDDDSDAATAHAENQFISGDYEGARQTLRAAIRRHRGAAKTFPVAVADLWRSDARVSAHLGLGSAYRLSAIAAIAALKTGLGEDDPRYIAQRLELGDAYARLGDIERAREVYRWGIRRTAQSGAEKVRGYALFRLAALEVGLNGGNSTVARETIAELIGSTSAAMAPYRTAGLLLDARSRMKEDGGAAFERILAGLRTQSGERPILIGTGLTVQSQRNSVSRDLTNDESDGASAAQWVDIGFWIRPDGSVADVDMMRESPDLERDWVAEVSRTIATRRYAPLATVRDGPGLFRVERYTRTLLSIKDYRSREPNGNVQILMFDLSSDPVPQVPR